MRRLIPICLTLLAAGCNPPAANAPLGSQLFISVEAIESLPGNLFNLQVLVLNPDGDMALNNIRVEFHAYGAILLPPEAVVGVSNQLTDTDGDGIPDTSPVSWCEAYVDDEQAYQDCFNDYYFEFLGVDSGIGADYARVATDGRGIAEIYLIPFCGVSSGTLVCESTEGDLAGAIEASIGVDNAVVTLSYSAG